MINLDTNLVEKEIIKILEEIKGQLKIEAAINEECLPGELNGITSQILITAIGRLANTLKISIPLNCYIFHDKISQKQLTIKEAAQKLIKSATNGK